MVVVGAENTVRVTSTKTFQCAHFDAEWPHLESMCNISLAPFLLRILSQAGVPLHFH